MELFAYHSYEEINALSLDLRGSFAEVGPASEVLSVKAAVHRDGTTCSPMIIRVTHRDSLAKDKQRPQVFISGEIHGNERVGPLASLFTAQMLVWAAQCEIEKKTDTCMRLRKEYRVGKKEMIWLSHLVTRRDIYIVPTTNCLGYIKQDRLDAGVDPNRDFPYVASSNKCLQSTTANIIVELFRRSIIQSVVTFHGGMEAIGYEWGDMKHKAPNDTCPGTALDCHSYKFNSIIVTTHVITVATPQITVLTQMWPGS
jgi:predicted deacylase